MSAIASVGNDGGQYYVKLSQGKDEVKIPCKDEAEANALKSKAEEIEAKKEGKDVNGPEGGEANPTAATSTAAAPAPNAPQSSAFQGVPPDAGAINQATLDQTQGKNFQACA